NFIFDVIEKNVTRQEEIAPSDIDTVLCVGGGFEMLWAREAVANIFSPGKIQFYNNSKTVIAEGAATIAAHLLEASDIYSVTLEDKHQLSDDIGLRVTNNGRLRFLPIVERNAFWWQKHQEKTIIYNAVCDGGLSLEFAARNASDEVRVLTDLVFDGLPVRPKGATKIGIKLQFVSDTEMKLTVRDCGFGELFPKTDYEKTVTINI
ncbi:MAG: DUF5716 family protein, partial [Defluviitaleaceae bacterium]|nr:DUF5716 family protein [Defluviitaleaceae bacterium]